MANKTYYEILQAAQTADADTIKTAYNSLILRFYPDGSPRDPNDEFLKTLNQAYEILSDPSKRAGYDAALARTSAEATINNGSVPAKPPAHATDRAKIEMEASPYITSTLTLSWATKIVYCLSLFAIIFPFGTSGWVTLTMGMPFLGALSLAPLLFVFVLGAPRILRIIREPGILDIYVYSPLQKLLTKASAFLLYIGAISLVLRFLVPVITRATIGAGDNGIGYYVVGMGVALLGTAGPIALILFEYARILGFEQRRREVDNMLRIQ